MKYAINFSFAMVRVGIRCDSSTLLEGIRAILEPGFADDETLPPDLIVDIEAGSLELPAFDYERPWRSPPLLMIEGTVENALRIVECDPHHVSVIREGSADCDPIAIRVSRPGCHWSLRTISDGLRSARAAARALKYLIGCMVHKSGVANLHASCVDVDGRGVILVGERGSGKSTFMFLACTEAGARFVSDDQVICWMGDTGSMRCGGWPRRVGVPTSALINDLRRSQVLQIKPRRWQNLPENWHELPIRHLPPERRERVMLDVDEFLRAFDLDFSKSTSPVLIVSIGLKQNSNDGWELGPDRTSDTTLLTPYPKHLKLFTDYLAITPSPDRSEPAVAQRQIESIKRLRLLYGMNKRPDIRDVFREIDRYI